MNSASIRRKAKSRARRRLAYLLVTIALVAVLSIFAYSALNSKSPVVIDSTPKIAIVDQLGAKWPDPKFEDAIQGILNQTGLKIDYYPSEDVNVDFYRTLPSHNYKLIIFRVHSTATAIDVNGTPPWVVFFTSENYSRTAYVPEQSDMRLAYVKFFDSDQMYFGITPKFVTNSMEGRFNDTAIIAMGCESLKFETMADAFIQKGARIFIGWNGPVSENQTDNAAVLLLRHLITEKESILEAVNQTRNELSPDPTNNSMLTFYPGALAGTNLLIGNAAMIVPTVRVGRTFSKADLPTFNR